MRCAARSPCTRRPTTSCCAPTSRSRPARRAWSTSSSASSIRTRPDVIAQPQNPTKVELVATEEKSEDEEEGEENGESEEEEAVDTGPDPVEAATRFASIAKIHAQVLGSIAKLGAKDPKTLQPAQAPGG